MSGTSNAGTPTGDGAKPNAGRTDAVGANSGNPIQLNQFRLWQNQGLPMCFATWAFLDDKAEARIRDNIKKLAPADWKSGDPKKDGNLWLIDIAAPFGAHPKGGPDAALKELREQLFPGKRFKMLQPAPSGQGVAVVEW